MNIKKNIIGKQIVLKNLNIKNFNPNYYKWLNDPLINRFLEVRFNKQNIKKIIDFITMCNKKKNCLLLGIFYKHNNLHIGNIKLEPINHDHRRGEIGIIVGEKEYWGQGIATEAIKLTSEFSLKNLKLKKLTAGCYSNNIGSKNAFLKAGWKVEAKIKNYWFDHISKKRVDEIILTKDLNK